MSTDVFTWIGRVMSALFLVLIASIALAAIDGRVRDWREGRLNKPIPLVPTRLADGAWCDCGDCARITAAIYERASLEALYALPVYDPETQR